MRINAVASATREKQFAGHLINEDPEIIFLDEWTSDSSNVEDAKKVLQGGLQILPRKIEKLADFTTNLEFLSLLMSCQTFVKAQMFAQSERGSLYLR